MNASLESPALFVPGMRCRAHEHRVPGGGCRCVDRRVVWCCVEPCHFAPRKKKEGSSRRLDGFAAVGPSIRPSWVAPCARGPNMSAVVLATARRLSLPDSPGYADSATVLSRLCPDPMMPCPGRWRGSRIDSERGDRGLDPARTDAGEEPPRTVLELEAGVQAPAGAAYDREGDAYDALRAASGRR